jgi:transmembrane sensor
MAPELPEGLDDGAGIDPVELAAANWLVLQDRGLSADEQRQFERWLETDARHRRLYAGLRTTWGAIDRMPAGAIVAPTARRRWKAQLIAGSLAAAAALVFMASMLSTRRASGPARHEAVTPVGGFQALSLPDGSVVRLNTASAVEVAYSATERGVRLTQGEASFEVARDTARPFVVRVGEVDVRAVGTIFNIRRGSDTVEVLVTEGKVRVNDAASGRSLISGELSAPPRDTAGASADASKPPAEAPPGDALLVAGQRLRLKVAAVAAPVAAVVELAPDEVARALAWQNRRVEFDLEPLEAIVAEFNRYNRHQLVIADPRLAQQRFGGKFPARDIEAFVRSLETTFGVRVERRENETVLGLKP